MVSKILAKKSQENKIMNPSGVRTLSESAPGIVLHVYRSDGISSD